MQFLGDAIDTQQIHLCFTSKHQCRIQEAVDARCFQRSKTIQAIVIRCRSRNRAQDTVGFKHAHLAVRAKRRWHRAVRLGAHESIGFVERPRKTSPTHSRVRAVFGFFFFREFTGVKVPKPVTEVFGFVAQHFHRYPKIVRSNQRFPNTRIGQIRKNTKYVIAHDYQTSP